jgi:hypothetical protein
VGKVVVSTIGEYTPDRDSPDQFQEIGYKRKYETMVFALTGNLAECGICPEMNPIELDEGSIGVYNTASDAMKGHLKMCSKWSKSSRQKGVEST